MNLQIKDFLSKNNKIKKEYICSSQEGSDKLPFISWNSLKTASYAMILEDPDAVGGNYVHMYIPYIKNSISSIDKINTHNNIIKNINFDNFKINNKIEILFGRNSEGKYQYKGPCAPKDSGVHNYIFRIYALDGILKINSKNIFIKGSNDFKIILEKNNINIIEEDSVIFKYKYKDYGI